MPYPWYEKISGLPDGNELLQGDFLKGCPLILPPAEFRIRSTDEAGAGTEFAPEVMAFDVVILSQSCDLQEKKVDLALVGPVWTLDELGTAHEAFKSQKMREELRRGNLTGYHLLNVCDLDGLERAFCVVDFRRAFSLPLEYLRQLAGEAGPRLRLLPPYREHLAQALARFYMRVGLPIGIPQFK